MTIKMTNVCKTVKHQNVMNVKCNYRNDFNLCDLMRSYKFFFSAAFVGKYSSVYRKMMFAFFRIFLLKCRLVSLCRGERSQNYSQKPCGNFISVQKYTHSFMEAFNNIMKPCICIRFYFEYLETVFAVITRKTIPYFLYKKQVCLINIEHLFIFKLLENGILGHITFN